MINHVRQAHFGLLCARSSGFHFSLAGHDACLNFLFPTWTLNTRGKFYLAMLSAILMGILVQGLAQVRPTLLRRERCADPWVSHFLLTLIHGVQAGLGYLLMLTAMTFSLELLACTLLGLMLGHAAFFGPTTTVRVGAAASGGPVLRGNGGSPCCCVSSSDWYRTTPGDGVVDPALYWQQPLDAEYDAAPPGTTPCCPFNAPHAGREGPRLCDEADPPNAATATDQSITALLSGDLTQPLLDVETTL
jgi:Ctr copper transporter family